MHVKNRSEQSLIILSVLYDKFMLLLPVLIHLTFSNTVVLIEYIII